MPKNSESNNKPNLAAKKQAAFDQLLRAVSDGDTSEALNLIKQNPDLVNSEHYTGNCLLAVAASANYPGVEDVVQALIAAGADVNKINSNRMTPLMWAACYGKAQTIIILVANGADKQARDKDGRNALDLAIMNAPNDLTNIKTLIEMQVDKTRINRPLSDSPTLTPLICLFNDFNSKSIDEQTEISTLALELLKDKAACGNELVFYTFNYDTDNIIDILNERTAPPFKKQDIYIAIKLARLLEYFGTEVQLLTKYYNIHYAKDREIDQYTPLLHNQIKPNQPGTR